MTFRHAGRIASQPTPSPSSAPPRPVRLLCLTSTRSHVPSPLEFFSFLFFFPACMEQGPHLFFNEFRDFIECKCLSIESYSAAPNPPPMTACFQPVFNKLCASFALMNLCRLCRKSHLRPSPPTSSRLEFLRLVPIHFMSFPVLRTNECVTPKAPWLTPAPHRTAPHRRHHELAGCLRWPHFPDSALSRIGSIHTTSFPTAPRQPSTQPLSPLSHPCLPSYTPHPCPQPEECRAAPVRHDDHVL
jgi:hypothetical protein